MSNLYSWLIADDWMCSLYKDNGLINATVDSG
jgi:hypothetical protein